MMNDDYAIIILPGRCRTQDFIKVQSVRAESHHSIKHANGTEPIMTEERQRSDRGATKEPQTRDRFTLAWVPEKCRDALISVQHFCVAGLPISGSCIDERPTITSEVPNMRPKTSQLSPTSDHQQHDHQLRDLSDYCTEVPKCLLRWRKQDKHKNTY